MIFGVYVGKRDIFMVINLLKLANNEQTIQGPAVDAVIATINQMFGRGAPTEWDNTGFSKLDYGNPLFHKLMGLPPGSPVAIRDIVSAVQSLAKYQKRQVPHWAALRAGISQLLPPHPNEHAQQPVGQEGQQALQQNVVQLNGKDRYGNFIAVIKGLNSNRSLEKNIKNAVTQFIQNAIAQGDRTFIWQNEPAIFKAFNKDRSGFDTYTIHPRVIPVIAPVLEQAGYDVKMLTANETPGIANNQESGEYKKVNAKKVENGFVDIAFSYDKSIIDMIKMVPNRRFMGKEVINGVEKGIWTVPHNPAILLQLYKEFQNKGYEASELGLLGVDSAATALEQQKQGQPLDQPAKQMNVKNISATSNFHLAISFPRDRKLSDEMKEMIKFSFPSYGEEAMRFIDKSSPSGWTYAVKGEYSDYVNFGFVMKTRGWDTGSGSSYRQALMELMKNRVIDTSRYDGKLDGYQAKDENGKPINDTDKFYEDLDEANQGKPLWEKQKQGIAWLYSRQSAILGDETGAGKCLSPDSLAVVNGQVMSMEDIWNKYASTYSEILPGEEIGITSKLLEVEAVDQHGHMTKSPITSLFRQKFKGDLRKITTDHGRSVTTTFIHKFLTPQGWSNDISVGSIICSPSKIASVTNKTSERIAKIAELLAWQISEGNESNTANTCIHQEDTFILKHLKTIFDSFSLPKKKAKGNALGYIRSYGDKCPYLDINSRSYRELLDSLDYEWGLKAGKKYMPDFMMNLDDDTTKRILTIFFDAEGTIDAEGRCPEFFSTSKILANQIGVLLLRFGILHTIRSSLKMATNGKKKKVRCYRITVCSESIDKFASIIGFNVEFKKDRLDNRSDISNPNLGCYPVHVALKPLMEKYKIPYRHLGVQDQAYVSGSKWICREGVQGIISSLFKILDGSAEAEYRAKTKSKWTTATLSIYEKIETSDIKSAITILKSMLDSDLRFERIISVETVPHDGYIYDLTVDVNHNFLAEGLLCHNTKSMIGSAYMRMKTGGRCIVVTLRSTQIQWIKAIKEMLGQEVTVDTDPSKGAQFTVMHYHNFASKLIVDPKTKKPITNPNDPNFGKYKRQSVGNYMQAIMAATDITCLILDECHMVKNDSSTTENIAQLASKIPYKWGASATPIANKPIDAYNQLKILGHRLGKLTKGQFKKEFCGMVPRGYGGSYVDKDPNESEEAALQRQKEAAQKLREWLTLSGAYMKRTKKEINPNLPNHTITDVPVEIDKQAFQSATNLRLENYKKPDLVVSQMQAQRAELAKSKVPMTLDYAQSILEQGKKLLVFTCFRDAAQMLIEGLGKIIGDPSKVAFVLGGQKDSEFNSSVDDFKNPNGHAQAIVISILKGGTGLDLPNVVNEVVINDFSWTPKDAEQSEGRAFRINSETDVDTKYMIAAGTPDEVFFEYVQHKKSLAQTIQNLTQQEAQNIISGVDNAEIRDKLQQAKMADDQVDNDLLRKIRQFNNMGGPSVNANVKGNWYKIISG